MASVYPPRDDYFQRSKTPDENRMLSKSEQSPPLQASAVGRTDLIDPTHDAEKGQPASDPSTPPDHHHRMPFTGRSSSWDIYKKFEQGYDGFDTRNASEAHLAFAEGDVPKNKVVKFYNYLLNVSIITRWILFIVPILAVLWLPGILGLTAFPKATVWGVKLIWWSIWLSVIWGGWWASLAFARIFPMIARNTIGVVSVASRRYIDWFVPLFRYVALFTSTLVNWVSFTPIISIHQSDSASSRSVNAIQLISRLTFAIFLCSAVLLFEKFCIQWIARGFHEMSYAERIAVQKFAMRTLAVLYRNSRDISDRPDTFDHPNGGPPTEGSTVSTSKLFKAALRGVKVAAVHTTTALGNVASEITGSSILQPSSPYAMVKTALESAETSRLLARRLFYSFVRPNSDSMKVQDVARYFKTPEEAETAFALFDRDGNGDATREEVEAACMDLHRERMSLERSMQDVDSAVHRLDSILMSLYLVVAALIIAVAMQAQLLTLVTGFGTLILGLSWLIGGSLQEVLSSIIFLFVKHPFDVGDRVNIDNAQYTVKEIRLLSTVFLDTNGLLVQAPNLLLNQKLIQNVRRSPEMSEPFEFDVAYSTAFEQLETLREKMLAFVTQEMRDFQPIFDVTVVDFPDQESMKLKADIKYKSNWQQGALKAKRRNKWICALKAALAELRIYGPKGNPDAPPDTQRYTIVPWDEFKAEEKKALHEQLSKEGAEVTPAGGWQLSDKNAAVLDTTAIVFDEANKTSPRRGASARAI